MDWTNAISMFDTTPALPPASSAIPLSTPVNTSADANSSGSGLNSFFTTLSQLGTTAADAYATVAGSNRPAAPAPAVSPATTASLKKWGLIAVVVVVVVLLSVLLLRRK